MKKQLPGWAVLLIITLVAGLALGGTNALTKDPIEQQTRIKAENARKAALPEADAFEELPLGEGATVDWVYAGLKSGNPVGYVAQKTVNGFGGKVEVIAGVDTKAAPDTFTIGGITVGGSDFSETAGLGARAKEPAFTGQFPGKVYPISYIKAGGTPTESTVDALTSATITTTAVVNSVNDIVKYVKADVMGIAGVEMPAKPTDGVFSSSEKGFRGPVYVEAAFDAAGKVTYISVGDEQFAEDIGVGVVEPDFMIQFIGKQMPLEVSDIDVIAGATISSTAVVKALNNAYAIAGGAEIAVPETPAMPEKPAEGVYSASEQGFRGPVYVEAAFDGEAKITYLSVGDDQFAEDVGMGVKEPEFMAQFIGKKAPVDVGDIDVITGATISSTAVVNALNKAYNASQGIVEEPVEIVMPEKPAEGVFSASEQGFAGPVYTEAAFDADGKITYISVGDDKFAETENFGARALVAENLAPFIGAQMPLEVGDVDALTGATFTKTAIINALNKAYAASKGEAVEEPAAQGTADQEKPAATFKADADGFDGPVAVEAAFDGDKVTYLTIGDKRFNETEALGGQALKPEFAAQFISKTVPLTAADIDGITGATFTTNAVVEALNKAYAKYQAAGESAAEPAAQAPADTVSASAQGFGGPVAVEAVFDADGKITYINIGDDQFAETPGLGARALEDAFKAQFIGKQMPLALSDIDVLTGATVTSTAVVDALNAAYASTQAKGTAPAEAAPAAEPEQTKTETRKDGEYVTVETVSFFTAIRVKVSFVKGMAAGLAIDEKPVGADGEYASSPVENELKALFMGAELPLDVDAQETPYAAAVASAINQAYGAPVEVKKAEKQAAPSAEPAPAEPTPAEPVPAEPASSAQKVIQVTADFEQDQLISLSVSEKAEGIDAFSPVSEEAALKEKFLGATLPLDTKQPSLLEATVAIAINKAYYENQHASAQDADPEPAAPAVPVEDAMYEGEAVSFFTAIQAKIKVTPHRTVEILEVYDKAVGAEAYAASQQDEEMQKLFVGEKLPVSVDAQETPYAVGVALAINQAFEKCPEAEASDILDGQTGSGETVSFFTVYTAAAGFKDGSLVACAIHTRPVGGDEQSEALLENEALYEALAGHAMPLVAADLKIEGVSEYEMDAIALALNQAYQNSLAGQQ